jgi:hypothetical protein
MQKKGSTSQKTIKEKISKPASSKKSMPSKEIDDHRNQLLRNLHDLIKDLDEKSLLFLVQQAQVLQYNLHVEKLNATQEIQKSNIVKPTTTANRNQEQVEIIEGGEGQLFILVMNQIRKSFSLEEMRKIVKICHISKGKEDASGRLFNWFVNNRRDVVHDVFLASENDPALILLYEKIMTSYTVKKS